MKILEKARAIRASMVQKRTERKRLRGPARLQYAVADRIAMLNADAWDALVSDAGFFMSRRYLAGIEPVLPDNLVSRYALIHDGDGQPLAAVYMQIAEIGIAQVRPVQTPKRARVAPIEKIAEQLTQRVLTCGNLLAYGQHGVAFAASADANLVWHGVAEVLYRVRNADKLRGRTHFVLVKDIHEPYTKQAACLVNLSYRYVETEPNMVLTLGEDWKSYDDYLANLASKYRSGIRNAVFKPMDEAGCTVEVLKDVGTYESRIHLLYQSVQANADFRPYLLRPEYFSALAHIAADKFRCSVVVRENVLLGFLITIADGETAIAYHIGFDRAAAADLPVYLRLLHAGIADAIALGCKRVSFGRTALEPKAALGAKPQQFGVLLRHRQPVLNKLIKRLLLGIEHEEAPDRNPFKRGK